MFRFAPETRLLRQHEAREKILDVDAAMLRAGFPLTGRLYVGGGDAREYEIIDDKIVLTEPLGRDVGPAIVIWASVSSGEVQS